MIRNKTAGYVVVDRSKPIRTLLAQATGLMFRPRLYDEGWVFLFPKVSKWHITNLFVFQSIDVLWLDSDKRVLQKKLVRPFVPHAEGIEGTAYVVELPALSADLVQIGDELHWKF